MSIYCRQQRLSVINTAGWRLVIHSVNTVVMDHFPVFVQMFQADPENRIKASSGHSYGSILANQMQMLIEFSTVLAQSQGNLMTSTSIPPLSPSSLECLFSPCHLSRAAAGCSQTRAQ